MLSTMRRCASTNGVSQWIASSASGVACGSTGKVWGPGTAKTDFPCSSARSAVIMAPPLRLVSTTITPIDIYLGGVMVYDVTNPAAPTFVQYVNTSVFTGNYKTGAAKTPPLEVPPVRTVTPAAEPE